MHQLMIVNYSNNDNVDGIGYNGNGTGNGNITPSGLVNNESAGDDYEDSIMFYRPLCTLQNRSDVEYRVMCGAPLETTMMGDEQNDIDHDYIANITESGGCINGANEVLEIAQPSSHKGSVSCSASIGNRIGLAPADDSIDPELLERSVE